MGESEKLSATQRCLDDAFRVSKFCSLQTRGPATAGLWLAMVLEGVNCSHLSCFLYAAPGGPGRPVCHPHGGIRSSVGVTRDKCVHRRAPSCVHLRPVNDCAEGCVGKLYLTRSALFPTSPFCASPVVVCVCVTELHLQIHTHGVFVCVSL